jgi:methyl coenzyme M reductase subunit D
MELCEDIENLFDVPQFVLGLVNQSARMTDCTKVIGATLRFGDINVTDSEVYEEICGFELKDILEVTLEILRKVFPMFFQVPKKKNTSRTSKKQSST